MDFTFSKEEEAFRREIWKFLENECTDAIREALWEEGSPEFSLEFSRKLAARGWLCLHWPKEYGGSGASMFHQLIFNEAMGYFEAPIGAHRQGVGLVGPTLIVHGTEEQKKKHLGPIARAEVVWCEGLSEPEAGSDAAAIRTRAVRQGDHYIINGQKVWTSHAHCAQWMYLTARTNPDVPKTHGISYFLLDMKTPGLTVRPLATMFGFHHFNEVFFDDVKVPIENLVGGENNGWKVVNTLLEQEHSQIGVPARCLRMFERLVRFCKETEVDGKPLSKDPAIRSRLAEMAIEIEVARVMAYHVAWSQSKHQHFPLGGPMNKSFSSDLELRLARLGMDILGLYGPLNRDSKWAMLQGEIRHKAVRTMGWTVSGGSARYRNTLWLREVWDFLEGHTKVPVI